MHEEYDALIEDHTWNLVQRPPNANVIRSLWIFRLKTNFDGSFQRYKARLVSDGKSQRRGVDYDKTFKSVIKSTSICLVLSTALSKCWPIHQLDVKNVFLYGYLN